MWISGWTSNKRGNDQVLWHVKVPAFEVLLEKTKNDPEVNIPTFMISFKNRILFAEKGSREVEMEEKMEPALENVLFCPVSARCAMHKKA